MATSSLFNAITRTPVGIGRVNTVPPPPGTPSAPPPQPPLGLPAMASPPFVGLTATALAPALTTVAQPPPPPPPGVAVTRTDLTTLLRPTLNLPFRPNLIPFVPLLPKTTTQLARASIKQLSEADAGSLREALNAMSNAGFAANRLINTLERHVKVGETLNELAKDWSEETKTDFAKTFHLEPDKLAVMDSLVSIAVLNDPELEEELRVENMPSATDQDMIENRRVIWQHPPAGTPLNPPYLVIVAVERQDIAKAEDVVQSILSQLAMHENVRLPKTAIQKLR